MGIRNLFTGWFSKGKSAPSTEYGNQREQNTTPNVNFDSAMKQSAFWAASRILSETVASMPLRCYSTESGLKTPTTDYHLWNLLNYKPNRYQSRTEFWEQIMLNLVTNGNAYVEISRDPSGKIFSLLPINSSEMQLTILEDGSITYIRSVKNNKQVYAENSIWHIRLFGGLVGLSPLAHSAQSISTANTIDLRINKIAHNGGKQSGILSFDSNLKPEQKENIKKNIAAQSHSDGLMVLDADMKFQQFSLSPSDMQLLENRRFSTEEICRFMGVPSILINDASNSTSWGSGIGELKSGFYEFSIKPYLERIESSLKRNLMPEKDWNKFEMEFDFNSLLRADLATRVQTYSAMINSGQASPNEVRAKEGLPPQPGGDVLYVNGALLPVTEERTNKNTVGREAQALARAVLQMEFDKNEKDSNEEN